VSARIRIERAGPLCTIQDLGRPGLLAHGISASGPMDRSAHDLAGAQVGTADDASVEFTQAGVDVLAEAGEVPVGWAGGAFGVRLNGQPLSWPGRCVLVAGDQLSITPGPAGNYGYLRFDGVLDVPDVLGSKATSTRARIGGLSGRALQAGDVLDFLSGSGRPAAEGPAASNVNGMGPIRFIWGIHAERFDPAVRRTFVEMPFRVTAAMDRMGVRLADEKAVFAGASILSLVSDPIMPGDIQILGDGTPIVLMRDHQPTGGYPRIGTIISADLDRFAQIRPGDSVAFAPVSVDHAHRLLRSRQV